MSNLGGNSPSEDTDKSNNLKGDKGDTGAQGDTGAVGATGISVNVLGSDTVINIKAKTAVAVGDAWIATDTGTDSDALAVVVGDRLRATDTATPSHFVNVGTDKGADGITPTVINIAAFLQGTLGAAELLASFVVDTPISFPIGLTGAQAYADTTATAAAVININKNGTLIGSVNFAIGASIATFTLTTATAFVAGDRLSFENQATADTTLADISITLRGDL